MIKPFLTTAAFALLASGAASAASASTTITSFDSGFYDSTGNYDSSNTSTFTGEFVGFETRGFWVFDLTGLSSASSLSVTFRENGAFRNDSGTVIGLGTETVNFYDYTGSIGSLLDGSAGLTVFNDLGSGSLLGQHTITAVTNTPMPEFTIVLPLSFVSQFNSAIASGDQRIAFGAAMQTSTPGGLSEGFWASSNGPNAAQLNITPLGAVPEPATWALMLLGFFAVGAALRRKPAVRSVSVSYS